MPTEIACRRTGSAWLPLACAASLLAWAPAEAAVKKIVVDKKVSPAFDGASYGTAGKYETPEKLAMAIDRMARRLDLD